MVNFDDANEKVTGNDNKESCLICHPLEIVNTEVISTFSHFHKSKVSKIKGKSKLEDIFTILTFFWPPELGIVVF